jgi:site-specific recombinase XerD
MTTTLHPLADRYVFGRRKRGEVAAKTARNMECHLNSLARSFGKRPLEQFTKRAIERWLETIGEHAPQTRRNMLGTVRGFCRWLVEEGIITSDPCDKVPRIRRPRTVPRALPAADVAQLLAACPDQRARLIVALMVGCGLRCIEVARLNIQDYDPAARTLSLTGKGGHQRVLPIPDFVHHELTGYLNVAGIPMGGPVIRSSRIASQGLSACTISTYVSRWFQAAGIKHGPWNGRSAHALRHTAASDVLDGGADLRVVQEMLGHEQLSSTAIYLRRAHIGQLREAMEGRDYRSAG